MGMCARSGTVAGLREVDVRGVATGYVEDAPFGRQELKNENSRTDNRYIKQEAINNTTPS